jgi:hypothetical protein
MSEVPTILIVEDDTAMRRGLKDNLQIEGYPVTDVPTHTLRAEASRRHRPLSAGSRTPASENKNWCGEQCSVAPPVFSNFMVEIS